MRVRWLLLVPWSLAFSGCASLQDHEYRLAQNARAHTAWWVSPSQRCSWNPASHYSCGWRVGYRDICMGGDGQCPPVPPPAYWKHDFQTELGQACVDSWFEGYADGAAAAVADCRHTLNPVPFSPQFRSECPTCLPADQAPFPHGRTLLGVKPVPPKRAPRTADYETPPEATEEVGPSSSITPAAGVDGEPVSNRRVAPSRGRSQPSAAPDVEEPSAAD